MPYGDFSVGQDKLSAYIGKIPRLFSTNNIQSTVKNNVSIPHIILIYRGIYIYILIGDNYVWQQNFKKSY